LGAVAVSALAGLATLGLVLRKRFEPARYTAALAVAAIIAGWGIAQSPDILPGLTIEEAAADRSVLIATLVGVAVGTVILVPSLALLFGLTLRGRFDAGAVGAHPSAGPRKAPRSGSWVGVTAVGCLLVGVPMTLLFDGGAGLAAGVVCLLGFVATGFVTLAGAVIEAAGED
jgi:cytochrome d ubiquinol oxidase subunit II